MTDLTRTYKSSTTLNISEKTIAVYEEAKGILQNQQFWFRRHAKHFDSLKQMFQINLACFIIVSILFALIIIYTIMSQSLILTIMFSAVLGGLLALAMFCYDHVKECDYHAWHCRKNIHDISSTLANVDARIKVLREEASS